MRARTHARGWLECWTGTDPIHKPALRVPSRNGKAARTEAPRGFGDRDVSARGIRPRGKARVKGTKRRAVMELCMPSRLSCGCGGRERQREGRHMRAGWPGRQPGLAIRLCVSLLCPGPTTGCRLVACRFLYALSAAR